MHNSKKKKYWVTGSVLNKNNVLLFVFVVGEEYFTLSSNVNTQSNRWWCYKNPEAVREVSCTSPPSAVCGHKVVRPMFFKEANSNHRVKLLLAHLFRELTEDKFYENSRYLQKLRGRGGGILEDKVPLFQDNSSVVCWEIFLQDAKTVQKLEVGTSRFNFSLS